MEWFWHSADVELRGVALVIHGLNLKPARMSPVISALNESGNRLPETLPQRPRRQLQAAGGPGRYSIAAGGFQGGFLLALVQETLTAYSEARQKASKTACLCFWLGFPTAA